MGYSPVAVHGLLIEVASLAVEQGLSCSAACEIFLDQGLNPYLLHWQVDFYPLYHQEVQVSFFFFNSLLTSTFFLSPVLLSFFVALGSYKGSATDPGWSKRLQDFQTCEMVLSYSNWTLSKLELSRHLQSSCDSKRSLNSSSLGEELPQHK